MTADVFATPDDVHHHLDADDQPRVVMPIATYTRLRAIEAAAVAHVAECDRLAQADAHHADRSLSYADRGAAMAALLIARGGVVASSAGLVTAVAK